MKERGGDLQAYFNAYAAGTGSRAGIRRAVNALVRGEIRSMEQLCGMAYKDLTRVRNLGEKSIELIARVRLHYLAEQD